MFVWRVLPVPLACRSGAAPGGTIAGKDLEREGERAVSVDVRRGV